MLLTHTLLCFHLAQQQACLNVLYFHLIKTVFNYNDGGNIFNVDTYTPVDIWRQSTLKEIKK